MTLTSDEAIIVWEVDVQFEGKAAVSHLKIAQLYEGT